MHFGNCAICGKYSKLTYEHIPPKDAFNYLPLKGYTGDAIIDYLTDPKRKHFDFSGMQYTSQQRGNGKFSLCESCNNKIGSWYGSFYCEFANGVLNYIMTNKSNYDCACFFNLICVEFKPLNFIKQVASMFASVDISFTSRYNDVRSSLLDKNFKIYSPEFKIYFALTKDEVFSIFGPTSMDINTNIGSKIACVSQLNLFPFIFLLDYEQNANIKNMVEITNYFSYDYDQKIELNITLPIIECKSIFPLHFK